MYGVYTVLLAGKLQNIRSYTVSIYGSGQPYVHMTHWMHHLHDKCIIYIIKKMAQVDAVAVLCRALD